MVTFKRAFPVSTVIFISFNARHQKDRKFSGGPIVMGMLHGKTGGYTDIGEPDGL